MKLHGLRSDCRKAGRKLLKHLKTSNHASLCGRHRIAQKDRSFSMLEESTINVRNRFLRCFSDKVASRFFIWQQHAGILVRNATE